MKHYEKRLKILLQEVIKEARNINIPISENIYPDVIINYRAKKRFGACKTIIKDNKKHFQIEIGSALSVCSDDILKNILIHEIIHTCEGCLNHGKLWKIYAEKANEIYGYNVKRTSTYEEIGICINDENKGKYKYKIVCDKCQRVSYRVKKSSIVKNPSKYRCACGGRIIVENLKL